MRGRRGPTTAQEPWLALADSELAPLGSLDRVQRLQVLAAQVLAVEVQALAARAAPGHPGPVQQTGGALAVPARAAVDDRVIDELAPALRQGRMATRRQIARAEQLARCLPRTLELLAAGLVDHAVTRAVLEETATCTEAATRWARSSTSSPPVSVIAGRCRRAAR